MKILKPVRRSLFLSLLLISAMSFSGCVWLIVGGIGALGGYVISPDTVEGIVSHTYDDVIEAVVDVVQVMGSTDMPEPIEGQYEAIINGARVWIEVAQFTSDNVRLTVSARKALLPSIRTAQDVYIKIMNQLE